MTAVVIEQRTGRSLVSDQLFRTLTQRIVSDDGISLRMAERITDQALARLAAGFAHQLRRIGTSPG